MDFEIAKVVKQVMDEVKAAEAEGLPVAMPNYVRFEKDGIMFEIPILRLQFSRTMVDYNYSYGGKTN